MRRLVCSHIYHLLHSSSLFEVRLFCALRPHGCCHKPVGQALAEQLLLLVPQLKFE